MFPRACRLAAEGNVAGQKNILNIRILLLHFWGWLLYLG